jgi:hypothetical protein
MRDRLVARLPVGDLLKRRTAAGRLSSIRAVGHAPSRRACSSSPVTHQAGRRTTVASNHDAPSYRRCPRLGRQVRYRQAAVQRWLTGAFGSDPERVAKRSQYPRAAEDGQAAEEDT